MKFLIHSTSLDSVEIKLDLSELPIPDKIKNSNLCLFPVRKIYKNLYRKDTTGCGRYVDTGAFEIINKFFDTLTVTERIILSQTLLLLHKRIEDATVSGDLASLQRTVADNAILLDEKFSELSLLDKLEEFIKKNVTVLIDDKWGQRSIDTESKTYTTEDVHELHKLVFVCKILTPVFGAIIARSSSFNVISPDMLCLQLFFTHVNNRIPHVRDKLLRYIRAISHKHFQEDMTALHNGHTELSIENRILATFCARKSITYDVSRPEGKLVTVLKETISYVTNDCGKTAHTVNKVKSRTTTHGVLEEDNQSVLERDSIVSKRTADAKIMARAFSPRVTETVITTYDLDPDIHQDLVNHLVANSIQVNQLSQLILQMLYCTHFGGITSLHYLSLRETYELLAAAQQYVAMHRWTELCHAMSMQYSGYAKAALCPEDHAILVGHNKTKEYARYSQIFEHPQLNTALMKTMLQKRVNDIFKDVTHRQYLYNTSPELIPLLSEEVVNGSPIQFTVKLTAQLFECMYALTDDTLI